MPNTMSPKIKTYLDGAADRQLIKKIYEGSREAFRNEGMMLICRIQKKRSVSISVVNGELNDLTNNSKSGIGIHGFEKGGASAMVTSNTYPDIDFDEMTASLKTLINASLKNKIKKNSDIFSLEPQINILKSEYSHPFSAYPLQAIIDRVTAANKEIVKIDKTKLSVTTSCGIVVEEYIIIRGDGTFSAFETPRCSLSSSITAKDADGTATVAARLGSSDLSVLFDEKLYADFMGQASFYAKEALRIPSSPQVEAGKYRIVIDYALAKGLAHEAFGHAVESDLGKSSILWEGGKFIKGRKVANEKVNITDSPILNDYAWQPVGANGNLRKNVEIVKDGVVKDSLADIFSAGEMGVSNQNAERIESYDCPSIPRMTNIRLEYLNPIPSGKAFHDIRPREVNELLLKNGFLAEDGDTLLLLGYKGGQVSTVNGDFVFNCSMIFKMNATCLPELYKPAIFAGKTLSTLKSIIGAIGPVKWDALGTCGKNGQGVPSSGGSNYFLIIDKNDDVTIG
ncbi:MAG TPA: TldD/PmbA family protein [Candidatus Wallbacteria bacterium]|nr:TldD/PmbA family protein [Candidatus Wallbacteria bacterium]